jgi:hypothetical protein
VFVNLSFGNVSMLVLCSSAMFELWFMHFVVGLNLYVGTLSFGNVIMLVLVFVNVFVNVFVICYAPLVVIC